MHNYACRSIAAQHASSYNSSFAPREIRHAKNSPTDADLAGEDADVDIDVAAALLLLQPSAQQQEPVAVSRQDSPSAVFYPGMIVWAKVEGHEWWPAQVVRRRAVPRTDVGPPPGGAANVLNCFPVVFLNQRGIPGEIRDTLGARLGSDSSTGINTGNDDFEAEYAWVMASSLRPFEPGDYTLVSDHIVINRELATCVAAAEAAIKVLPTLPASPDYDSDGGWGSAQPASTDASGAQNRRARTNRSRGTRRVRGRRATGNADDADAAVPTFTAPQIVVDSILGWRHSTASTDQVRAGCSSQLSLCHMSCTGVSDVHRSTTMSLLTAVMPNLRSATHVHETSKRHYECCIKCCCQLQNGGLQRKGSGGADREFLIKWHEHSHIRNEWVPETRVMALAKRKLLNFTKKFGDEPVDLSNPRWTIPERFVARRKCPFAPGWEILVKWTGGTLQQVVA